MDWEAGPGADGKEEMPQAKEKWKQRWQVMHLQGRAKSLPGMNVTFYVFINLSATTGR
jgi:hypothetical protein